MGNGIHKRSENNLYSVVAVFLLGFFLFYDLDIRYIYGYLLLGAIVAFYLVRSVMSYGMKAALDESFRSTGVSGLKDVFNSARRSALFSGMKEGLSSGLKIRISTMRVLYTFFVFWIVLFALLPNSNKEHEAMSIMISMVIFTVYFLLAESGRKEMRGVYCAVQIMSILFAAYTIIMTLNPDMFWTYVYPYLGELSQERIDELAPQGYGVLIGGSTSYAIFVMSFSIFMNEAKVLIGKIKNIFHFVFVVFSTVLYLTAILLINRRSELLSIIAAGLLLLILSIKRADKKEWGIRIGAVGTILIVQVFVLFLLAPTGLIDRHLNLVKALIPEQFTVSTSVDTEQDTEGAIETEAATEKEAPTEAATEAPTEAEQQKESIDANELTSGRMALWKRAIELFKENPIFGIGWKQFVNHNTYEHNVHNTYLQWLCESGIVGFILLFPLFAAMYIITLMQTRRLIRAGEKIPYYLKEMNYVSLGVQTLFLVLHFMDSTFYHLYFFVFYSFTMFMTETSLRLECDYTGVESDWLRKKIFSKKKNRRFLR